MSSNKDKRKPVILVLGDMLNDVWVDIKPRQKSAEADIVIYDEKEARTYDGGAMNVVRNLERLGGVDVIYTLGSEPRPTKIRFIEDGEQVFRIDQNDKCDEIDVEDLDYLLENWNPDLVIVSDYGKGAITRKVIQALGEKYKGTVLVDTKKEPWFYEKYLDDPIFFPNTEEFHANVEGYLDASTYVRKMGDMGAEYRSRKWSLDLKRLVVETTYEPVWSPVENPRSVCGAGDVFLACFAQQWALGNDPISCLRGAVRKTSEVIRFGYDTLVYGNMYHEPNEPIYACKSEANA